MLSDALSSSGLHPVPYSRRPVRADGTDLLWCTAAPGPGLLKHAPEAARREPLSSWERGEDDARADRVNPRIALTPAHRFAFGVRKHGESLSSAPAGALADRAARR